ncbi:hypothetical protein BN1708_014133 [Verticillium longisporum]|uniref:Uncharacterized protein n=3 Tax=Verticillium TaxID=1036719 RepID=A0A0G4LSP3_VERLO|nr:hypothetical protein BN1708_014133 [Verticillium longisporum]
MDSESDTESFAESGYCSAEENPDDEADYLRKLISQYAEEGPTMANHGENTKKMTRPELNRFCRAAKLDSEESMKACKASIFKTYLHWRVKKSRIKKESSIMTYWNVLSMVYAEKTSRYMDGGVLFDIGNVWIHTTLTPEFGLDTSKKVKSGLYVEDLDLILHHHYVRDEEVYAHERLRVQLALILIIAGATATRPDALIGKVLYKHIEFQLFPPTAEGERPRLGLVWNLEHIKRSAGTSEKKVFGFHEEDTLLHDPVLHALSLVLADDAFLNGFCNPEQIYDLVVPPQSDRLRLMWKEDWRERPIFRDTDGLQVALDKALTYGKTRDDLIRLGRALGYAKKLEFYDLRRGSGKKLNEALTPEERNKTMGHRLGDSSTYVRYYMGDFIDADTQSIAFGSDLQTDLIHLMGRLQRHGDAPTKLTDEQRLAIHKDPKLAGYCKKRRLAMEEYKREGYRSYTAAKDTQAGKDYNKYRKKVESLRTTLINRRLDQAIKDFHDTIHAEEVDRQLQGTKPDAELLAPSTIKYELPERAEVARLFSQAADVTNR